MVQVHIVSERGSLYYAAAHMTLYDLENLHGHVRALRGREQSERTWVEFELDAPLDETTVDGVSALADRLSSTGVRVVWSGLPMTHDRVPLRPAIAS